MILQFKYYLHDDKDSWSYTLMEELDLGDMSEEDKEQLAQKVGSPFYEVTLYCELDTDTGDVTIKDVKKKKK